MEEDKDIIHASSHDGRSPDVAASAAATAHPPKAVLQISLKFSLCIQNLSGFDMEITDLSTERCYFLDADPVIKSQTMVRIKPMRFSPFFASLSSRGNVERYSSSSL